jgi:hypothetical protein
MKLNSGSIIARVLLVVALVLLPWIGVANADGVKVTLTLPGSVAPVTTFNIGINVNNDTNNAISFNKIAVAYALQDLKVRGPYEVNPNGAPHLVAAHTNLTVTVPFKILFATGVIVPITVVLANGSYTQDHIIGGTIGGVQVN